MEAKIKTMGEGRTMLMMDGMPVKVGMVMRQSTTAHARWKAALVVPTVDADGEVGVVPLPFAVPTMGAKGKTPRGYTPEFRIEMN